jgi:hypothetical protein
VSLAERADQIVADPAGALRRPNGAQDQGTAPVG